MSKFLSLVVSSQAPALPVVSHPNALAWSDFTAHVPDTDASLFAKNAFASTVADVGFLAISSRANFAPLLEKVKAFKQANPDAQVFKSLIEYEANFVWFVLRLASTKDNAPDLAQQLHNALRSLITADGVLWFRRSEGEYLDNDTLEEVANHA